MEGNGGCGCCGSESVEVCGVDFLDWAVGLAFTEWLSQLVARHCDQSKYPYFDWRNILLQTKSEKDMDNNSFALACPFVGWDNWEICSCNCAKFCPLCIRCYFLKNQIVHWKLNSKRPKNMHQIVLKCSDRTEIITNNFGFPSAFPTSDTVQSGQISVMSSRKTTITCSRPSQASGVAV